MEEAVLKNIEKLLRELKYALDNQKCLLAQTLTLELIEEVEKLTNASEDQA